MLSPVVAGAALLSGQITDGVTTPIVGICSDKFKCAFGKRNTWYYFGSLLVIPSFAGIFVKTPKFLNTTESKTIWYCVLPSIFNIGWASVQIAHMAIVNSLTFSMTKRDRMVTNRNALTYGANITVLSLSLLLFLFIQDSATSFTVLCLICLSFGSCTTLFYISQINEKYLVREAARLELIYKTEKNVQQASKINLSGDIPNNRRPGS